MPARIHKQAFLGAVDLHERFVTGRPGGRRLVMRFARLAGLMMQKRILSGADLTGSNLSGAKLAASDLASALLYCCDLRDIDMRGCDLTNADLRGSSLRGARLYGARLDGADLRDARLAKVDADGAFRVWTVDPARTTPNNADGVMIQGVDFRHSSLKRAKLAGAKLKGADLSGANLAGAELAYADLRDCVFSNAILTGVDLRTVRIDPQSLSDCVLDPDDTAWAEASVVRAALNQAEIWFDGGGRTGQCADLSGRDVRPAADAFAGRRLAALRAVGMRAIDVNFSESILVGAVFRGSDLRGAIFSGCDLRGASFVGCQLAFADFTGATFGSLRREDGSKFTTDFTDANLTGALLDEPPPVASETQPDVVLAC